MGFLFGKNKQQNSTDNVKATENQPVISLTKNPELNKTICLRKDIIQKKAQRTSFEGKKARVVFVLDHSGSMRKMYNNGTVQTLLERIFPMAMYFDDNSELDFYWFDSLFRELPPVTPALLEDYVNKIILANPERFGGTCYAPVMNEIFKKYVKISSANIPTFVIFITDGANSDKGDASKALINASRYNIFWKFIGIGKERFEFLERLDNLKGRFIDNANFVNVNDLYSISDDDLYTLLLEEYDEWLTLCRKSGIPVD